MKTLNKYLNLLTPPPLPLTASTPAAQFDARTMLQ